MMTKKFTIQQEPGFYLDKDKATMPSCPGIFIVYKCDYDPYNDTVSLDEVLYIGETQNIYEYLNVNQNNPTNYKQYNDLVKIAGGANHMCYSVVPMTEYTEEQRIWIQDALIFCQKPVLNAVEKKEHYLNIEIEIIILKSATKFVKC